MLPAAADPAAFPPSRRLEVLSIATEQTQQHDSPRNGWSLDEIAQTLLREAQDEELSRTTIWRILAEADLKPHRSVYWLNSHDPDFSQIAKDIGQLYVDAPGLYQKGEVVLSTDEKTGMQILQRKYPTIVAEPGKPEKREHEYIRHGTRTLIASFCVPTGEVVWDLGPRRTNLDFRHHIWRVAHHYRQFEKLHWVVDRLNTHSSLDLCQIVAYLCELPFEPEKLSNQAERRAFLSDPEHKHVFHFLPRHGSWLNQVELFFSVLSRQFLKRGDFASAREFEERLSDYLLQYNLEKAHPYRWTYTGEPLVRETPFHRKRRARRQGRAWLGTRPRLWERLLDPPRTYRQRKQLAANL